jgi:hypothetical protein
MDKRKVQELLDAEPDNVDVDGFLSKLLLLEKLEVAEAEIAAGKGIAHSEAKQRLAKWLK